MEKSESEKVTTENLKFSGIMDDSGEEVELTLLEWVQRIEIMIRNMQNYLQQLGAAMQVQHVFNTMIEVRAKNLEEQVNQINEANQSGNRRSVLSPYQ